MKEFSILSALKRIIFIIFLSGLSFQYTFAQYQMERLNRGVVAVSMGGTKVFVSWRWLGTEDDNITFNLYRNGVKVNSAPLTVSNFTDNSGSTSASYTVKAIVNGVEQTASEAATPWAQKYYSLPLNLPAGGTTPSGEAYTYSPNDCSVGDVDGDGTLEIFVKWDPSNSKDNSQKGYTGNVYIDCYTMKGVFLWRIDLGRNIRAGAHYTQFLVYDFDGDGKAEMACKTADGTKDGKGIVIGSASADYRNSSGYILSGPEFLTMFNGQTGAAMSTVNYTPARGTVSSWGDSYGNRVDRFIAAVAYLDGQKPSMVFGRGYYTRLVRSAWDFKNGQLVQRWIFDSNTSGNGSYASMGNHQMTVGDVDGDGKQEVCNGASAIDNDGRGLYANGLGHGDALHMTDMDPDRPGQEVWQCHEEPGRYGNYGLEYRDAKTGTPLWGLGGGDQGDIGRCMAGDIDPRYKGYEVWGAGKTYTCKGVVIANSRPSECFGVYWDGDLQRELLDGSKLDEWDYINSRLSRLATLYDASYGGGTSCNTTKATPNIAGDLFGDWREEVILHSPDNKNLLIYTTTIPSEYKFRTLLHDPQYRVAIAWQNSAYNQPPHLGYYLGTDMATPAKPNIVLIGAVVTPVVPKKYIYNYDNSGNYAWSNTNSWTPKAVPTAIDTVIIRTGEVQINDLEHTAPVYVETNGILRLVTANSTINNLHMQGGTLKVFTSTPELALTSNITVDQPSTIMAGSVAATVFTLNGTITGNANLTKTGVGNLRINSTATGFKGNWIITEGKLQLRSASGLGVCGVQVKSGARLDIEVAGASIYSLVIEDGGGVDLDQNLTTSVAVFGTTNKLTGAYQNANTPSFIGSTGTLTVSNSLVSLSGATALCPGSNLTLTAGSGTSYIWKNNTTQVGTSTAYTTAAAGSYTVSATNSAGCKVTSAPVITTVNTAPTATITAPATSFCPGGSVVLTANTGASYKWFNGTNQVGTASTYTVTTAGSYTVEVTNASGCKATSAPTVITVAAAQQTPTITSPATSFCPGGSVVLTASAGTSYKWFNGTNQVATAATYTVTTAGSYTVEVTNASGCKATSAPTVITVTAAQQTPTITSPATSFCPGGSVVITASAGTSYKWFNGTTQVGTAVTYTATAAGSYTVEVTNAAGCKATSATTVITVTAAQQTPTITSPATSFCPGGSVVLTASAGTSYKWFNGTNQVATAATYTVTTAGSYTVEVTNASGCKATSAPTVITVGSAQQTPAISSPSTSFCPGSSVLLTASAGTSYKWFNGTAQVGTNPTYTATAAGSYTVEVTNASGCKAISAPTVITVGSAQQTPAISSPSTSFCAGSSILLTASAGASYKWFNGTNQVATTSTYTATAAGSYTVEVTNVSGCKATSVPFAITENTNTVATPTITSSSTSFCAGGSVILASSAAATYKWFNGTTQVGTSSAYTASAAGSYTVEVTNAAGCKATSAVMQITIASTVTWYADADNDGLGDIANTIDACNKPAGYVATSGDACPADANKTAAGNCGCGNTENSCLDCAGTPNGTAFLDNCSICVGGTTNNTACVSTATINGTSANIKVMPQPFDANTTITIENSGTIQSFTIISASGALVETRQGLNSTEIIIGDAIASGLYTVIITTETGIYTTKIVKK